LEFDRRFTGKEFFGWINMTPDTVITFAQQAIRTTILVSMPMLGLGLIVGLAISIFQAVTQIQEMTLTFVPKILIVLLALLFFASWMLDHLIYFTVTTIEQIPYFIR
jgi:flagellar biosynthesis protein FliQ